ncbi:MAG: sulfatase-like hydrolase/transferase [Phycisphaerae bacterium]|nr:sulfatase-like hydrolase/transferase [Phycisphaerae bacterium]
MKRREFLKKTAAMVIFAPKTPNIFAQSTTSDKTGSIKRKPNIIFIITDDQSWDTLGYTGGDVHTPRIDLMARQGLIFNNANITSTVCSPSRYTCLTGRYPGRCQGPAFMRLHPYNKPTQVENSCELEKDKWNIAKLLKKNGYKTGFVGKSHLINHLWLEKNNWAKNGLLPYPQNADPKDPEVNKKMQHNHQKWCDAIKSYGFDYADGIYPANLRELHNDDLNVHNLDWTVEKAFKFMEQNRKNPFYLYFSTTLHHGPAPWSQDKGKFYTALNADPHMTGEGYVEKDFDILPSRKSVFERNAAAGKKRNMAFALWLDDGIGAILDKLKKLKIEKDTLIVFISDHGSFRHGKATLYDYGMKVPMIMYWPENIKPGQSYNEIIANIDFAPTIMDICGIKKPSNYHIDGLSFKNVINGSKKPIHQSLFGELGHSRCVKTRDWKYIAIRYPKAVQDKINRDEKFTNFTGQPPLDRPYLTRNSHLGYHATLVNPNIWQTDQLYDLKNDPEENINVYDRYPEIATEMKKMLKIHLDSFPDRPFGEFTTCKESGYKVAKMPDMKPKIKK